MIPALGLIAVMACAATLMLWLAGEPGRPSGRLRPIMTATLMSVIVASFAIYADRAPGLRHSRELAIWAAAGLPLTASCGALALSALALGSQWRPSARVFVAAAASVTLAGALVFADRIRLLDAQLLILGGLVMLWLVSESNPSGRSSWPRLLAALGVAVGIGLLGGSLVDGSVEFLVAPAAALLAITMCCLAMSSMIGRAWDPHGERTASGVAFTLPVCIAFGAGSLLMSRVAGHAHEQWGQRRGLGEGGPLMALAEVIAAEPYVSGFAYFAPDATLAGAGFTILAVARCFATDSEGAQRSAFWRGMMIRLLAALAFLLQLGIFSWRFAASAPPP